MENLNNRIIFRYPSDSKHKIPDIYTKVDDQSVLIDEKYIKSRLLPLIEQTVIQIDEIVITISVLSKTGNHKYECGISIISPTIDFNLKDESHDYDGLIHSILEKTKQYIHKEKELIINSNRNSQDISEQI